MAEAKRFTREQNLLKQKREEDERRLGLAPVKMEDTNDEANEEQVQGEDANDDGKPSAVNSTILEEALPWQWNDEEQITFRKVVRINVNDEDACERVTDARVNGTPVVLVGHVGWANFARRWLVQEAMEEEGSSVAEEALLDLSQPHQLDVSRMIEDIGDEDVPVVRQNYNEEDPIQGTIKVDKFLRTCWPDTSRAAAAKANAKSPKLYLHQWQFPLSDTAGRKLCHQNNSLPNGILGEDLLKYWLDLSQCQSDSALQYLFMGKEGTMSKLHRDNGGLAISIAPVVGEKECVLVHRLDGGVCFYHLAAKLDDVDLDSYPLMCQARIWKTTITPGEILLMPHGTYHQCRNVTPCLSYSRFHLDTVNMLAFLQSMLDGDAKELAHEEVIWNSTTEIIKKVDTYTDEVERHVKSPETRADVPLDDNVIELAKTLRCLRHFCREISRRKTVQLAMKGPSYREAGPAEDEDDSGQAESRNTAMYTVEDWDRLTDDVDMCLHEFRYCRMPKTPRFRSRRGNDVKRVPLRLNAADQYPAAISDSADEDSSPVIAYANDLEEQFLLLPNIPADEHDISLPGGVSLAVNDCVTIHLMGKSVKGRILQIVSEMSAALLSYEEYPALYDEYQPYERLRVSLAGELGMGISPNDVRPGLVVVNRWGNLGQVCVASTYCNDIIMYIC
jgi:hypothetical protein